MNEWILVILIIVNNKIVDAEATEYEFKTEEECKKFIIDSNKKGSYDCLRIDYN